MPTRPWSPGWTKAVLIDVPFTRSQAHRIVAASLDRGVEITHIYITHSHPDHYFSAPVFSSAFPAAELITIPKISMNIGMSVPGRLKAWSGMLGPNGPGHVMVPKPYDQDFIELEGERLEILGPFQGDHPDSTSIHIPSIGAIVAGDVVFNGFHLFMAHSTETDRKAWLETIDYLTSSAPRAVVAGHRGPGLTDDPGSLEYCRDYLTTFEEVVSDSTSSGQVVAGMKNRFPHAMDVMNDFILTASAQVAMGEMEPVPETEGMED